MRSVTRTAPGRPWRGGSRYARVGHDAEAFHDFYVAMRLRVLAYFRRRTPDAEVAYDLAADTFATALQRRAQFRGESDAEAEAWLFAIARTRLAAYWRRGSAERRANETVMGWAQIATGIGDLDRIEELAALGQLRSDVRRAVAGLAPDQAYAVHQHVVCERGYDELAAELGVSAGVVRARVSRGLRALAARTAA